MAKSAKTQTRKRLSSKSETTKLQKRTKSGAEPKSGGAPASKQARVVTMLSSSDGATVVDIMAATGWQQHSVRGFLSGVVRKKLKLRLSSKKTGDTRIYRVEAADRALLRGRPTPPRSA